MHLINCGGPQKHLLDFELDPLFLHSNANKEWFPSAGAHVEPHV